MIFNHTSTAGSATITNESLGPGQTIFNDTSTAANASIVNAAGDFDPRSGQTTFNGASTADHASIANDGAFGSHAPPAARQFSTAHQLRPTLPSTTWEPQTLGTAARQSSTTHRLRPMQPLPTTATFLPAARPFSTVHRLPTAQSLPLMELMKVVAVRFFLMVLRPVAPRGSEVFDNGYLDISGHQSGVTIGSIEGSGNVFLGANRLRVGTNGNNTVFLRRDLEWRARRFAGQGRQRDTHFAN